MKEFNECYSATDSIEIGNVTYLTGKVTIGDIINFQNYCNKEAKKEAIELYALAGKEINMKELRMMVADSDYYEQKQASIEGVIYLFTCIVKRLNKDVDEEYLKANISVNDIQKLVDAISEDIPLEEEDKQENFPQAKAKVKKVVKIKK